VSLSRRRFLTTAATAIGAILASSSSVAAPYQVSVQRDGGMVSRPPQANSRSPDTAARSLVIPATMPMESGAPLGGISTGFVEIRAPMAVSTNGDLQLRSMVTERTINDRSS
jgi:hypothetical protein